MSGTVGAKLMAGPVSRVDVDKRTTVDVRCGVRYLSFSAHADARGICDLVRAAAPGAVMLVHGEGSKMDVLAGVLEADVGVPVHAPANGEDVDLSGAVSGSGARGAAGGGLARAALAVGGAPADPGTAADAGWRPAPAGGRVVDVEWRGDGAGGVTVEMKGAGG